VNAPSGAGHRPEVSNLEGSGPFKEEGYPYPCTVRWCPNPKGVSPTGKGQVALRLREFILRIKDRSKGLSAFSFEKAALLLHFTALRP